MTPAITSLNFLKNLDIEYDYEVFVNCVLHLLYWNYYKVLDYAETEQEIDEMELIMRFVQKFFENKIEWLDISYPEFSLFTMCFL